MKLREIQKKAGFNSYKQGREFKTASEIPEDYESAFDDLMKTLKFSN